MLVGLEDIEEEICIRFTTGTSSDEPRSPMSKGNARVSGTAPTYYTVDALDECPNTPDMPYPVT